MRSSEHGETETRWDGVSSQLSQIPLKGEKKKPQKLNSGIAAKGHGRLGEPAVRQEVWTQE